MPAIPAAISSRIRTSNAGTNHFQFRASQFFSGVELGKTGIEDAPTGSSLVE
jgi:hypothetical protein